jgi:ribosomal protein S12 methylthiotransferase accessory factor
MDPCMSQQKRWHFGPSPKVPGTVRVRGFEETEKLALAVAPRIPITRITNLTPLDPIDLPVYAAITPMARDLTTHLGKGTTHSAAKVSAIMEAIERSYAEELPEDALTMEASYEALVASSEPVCCPEDLDLPSDTLYHPSRTIRWVLGRDLIREVDVWVPRDLVVTPPADGVLHEIDTNGLASGNCLLEAVNHGLCEVIERDAVSQIQFCRMFGDPTDAASPVRPIAKRSLPAEAGAWVDAIERENLDIVVNDITNDLGVPSFRTWIIDHFYGHPTGTRIQTFWGTGTHVNRKTALLRSLTEALQARVAFVQGSRDSWNTDAGAFRSADRLDWMRHASASCQFSFDEVPSLDLTDLRDDLAHLLQCLRRSGIDRCLAVDLSRPGSPLSVVRVRVPGLSQFCVNQRRVGLRCYRYLAC